MPYGSTQCYLPPGIGVNPAFLPQPKQVHDLATTEECKAELTYGEGGLLGDEQLVGYF